MKDFIFISFCSALTTREAKACVSYHIFQKDDKRRGAGDVEEDPGSQGIQYQGDYKEDAVQAGEHHGCHTGVPDTLDGSV